MSADAACLSCPVCSHNGVFDSVRSLRDRLIHISTNQILCPVCQEEVCGLDKLTIHLFSHVKVQTVKGCPETGETSDSKVKTFCGDNKVIARQKKPKMTINKNKNLAPINAPVKFVKIFPKLPVISLNTVPMLDVSMRKENNGEPMYVKTETAIVHTNTICNICGLQFIDADILRMHRCIIHNIDENSDQNFTRYHCHLCPKNFKMRGSLMVHLRVAHFGFLSGNCDSRHGTEKVNNECNLEQQDEKATNLERNDNKQWQCEVCRKCFTTKYFLKKHKRLHTGETPYACTQCNKTFTFQQSYHKHLLYHNDEKPHTCTYCGRAFKELSTLHNHQRIHTGEKPFSCETCGSRCTLYHVTLFTRTYISPRKRLTKRVTLGHDCVTRPEAAQLANEHPSLGNALLNSALPGKCFRQRVSYLVHRRIHTGAMPYKCTACQKSFRYKVSQRTHKCQAQPPGTVVRQNGELVEKLRKKQNDSTELLTGQRSTVSDQLSYTDVSEANAELVRKGAKLSLEDMESEHFSIIADIIENADSSKNITSANFDTNSSDGKSSEKCFSNNIEAFIDSIPLEDKGIPSPSEILKNLCLSKEEDYIAILHQEDDDKSYDVCKENNVFL